MSIESSLYTILANRVSNRAYPVIAPANVAAPYITYQQIGGAALVELPGDLPDMRNARVQVNVWGRSKEEAVALMLQIEADLCAATAFTARPESAAFDSYSEDTERFGMQQDFSIWGPRS